MVYVRRWASGVYFVAERIAMTDREIIIELGRLMGCEIISENYPQGVFMGNAEKRLAMYWPNHPTGGAPWRPLESIADAFEVQAWLPKEKQRQYARELCFTSEAFMETRGALALHNRDWKLISATPRQRCMAILAVYGIAKEEGRSGI